MIYNVHNQTQSSQPYKGFGGVFAEKLRESDGRAQETHWKRTEYICGLDLGQTGDYSSLSILEPTAHKLRLRYITRYPLNMSYPDQVRYTQSLLAKLDARWSLVIDRTGVGRPVFDMFKEARLAPIAVSITSGARVVQLMKRTPQGKIKPILEFRVPKLELVSSLNVVMQKGQLRISKGLQYADTLSGELSNFQAKVKPSGHVTFEAREGEHDDLILSLALSCWWIENRHLYQKSKAGPMVYRAEGAAMG